MADPLITTVRQAWQDTIKTAIPRVNVSGWFNDGEKLPRIQLVEDGAESVVQIRDYGHKYALVRYRVVVEESSTDGISAAKRLDQYVSWEHDRSVLKAMLDAPTFGLTEAVVKSIEIADAWSVIPEELRAELPVAFYIVKDGTVPEEDP